MALTYDDARELDPKMSIEQAFPDPVIMVVIPLGAGHASVATVGGQPPPSGKCGFPKQGVGMSEPPQITVLSWDASPGCKTVIVNGVAYERCS